VATSVTRNLTAKETDHGSVCWRWPGTPDWHHGFEVALAGSDRLRAPKSVWGCTYAPLKLNDLRLVHGGEFIGEFSLRVRLGGSSLGYERRQNDTDAREVSCGLTRIFLIVDGHPTHKAKKVRAFVESLNGQVSLHLLPGYSPELNPDEWVWRNLKSGVMGKLQHLTKQTMKMEAVSHLRRLQKQPHIIRSFFHSETTRYAA
jgi:transposase